MAAIDLEPRRAPDVAILVLVTRSRDRFEPTLRAIAETRDEGIATEVVVVANGAPDDTLRFLARDVRGVTVLDTGGANTGTAASLNLAAGLSVAPLLCPMQEDVRPRAGWLAALAGALPGAGVVAPQVTMPDGSPQGCGWIVLRDGHTRPVAPREGAPFAVDYAPGSTMLLRREDFDDIGGFDERYFPILYGDADMGMAMQARGLPVLAVPGARTEHEAGSWQTDTLRRRYVASFGAANRERFVAKWADRLGEHVATDPARPAETIVAEALAAAATRGPMASPPRSERPRTGGVALHRRDDGWWAADPELARRCHLADADARWRFAAELFGELTELRGGVAGLERAAARRAEAEEQLLRMADELEEMHRALAASTARESELRRDVDALGGRLATLTAHETALLERSALLERILTGRWWRLRRGIRALTGR